MGVLTSSRVRVIKVNAAFRRGAMKISSIVCLAFLSVLVVTGGSGCARDFFD
jgi:hypothetical protein